MLAFVLLIGIIVFSAYILMIFITCDEKEIEFIKKFQEEEEKYRELSKKRQKEEEE